MPNKVGDVEIDRDGKRVLVVGHGPIGHSFIEKLMETQQGFVISVLCEEPRPAYNRVMLTQYFADRDSSKHDEMKLSYCTETFLQESGVQLIYGRAIAVDRAAKCVTYTENKSESVALVTYDILVMATGSYCFVPPTPGMTVPARKNAQWPDDPASRPDGVFVYRTIEDLDAMIAAAQSGARRAAVIGGGLLGLEAAKAVYDLKMESHVLEMAPYLMPTQLNEAAGRVLTKKIEALDIKVHTGVKILEVVHDHEKVVGIKVIENGAAEPVTIAVDIVVVSCGVRPRDELAKGCGLEIGGRGGVKVDTGLQSSDPSIYAIGEVAAIGGTFCYGLWAPGVEQAEVLVKNLVEGPGAAQYVKSDLSTKLKLLGVEVASFGRSMDFWMKRQFDCVDEQQVVSLENANPFEGTYRKLCFTPDGKILLGGLLVGDAKDYTKLLQLCQKDPEFVVPDVTFKLSVTANKIKDVPPAPAKTVEPSKKTDVMKAVPRVEGSDGVNTGTQRVLVVGHGPIGHSFIEKLTERQAGFAISVLCEEPRPAYNRVMLTQYFADRDSNKQDQMKLSYCTEASLQESGVRLIYGRATAVDRDAKSVTYTENSSGTVVSVAYDVLVMATGSYCFVPPTPGMVIPERKNPQWPDDPASRPDGVFVYRTIEDLDGMVAAAKSGARKAAVIGGGLLGLEAAKAVYDLKMESHVLEVAPYLMPTQLNEAAGRVLTKKIEALDIKVHAGVKILEVLHEGGKVVGIKVVEKGAAEPVTIEVDMVVVSCGVRPRDELAKGCGLETGGRGGIKVDVGLRSSDPSIYAIGEVAAIGGTFCYGLWAPGVEQAEVLVNNLVEGPRTSEYVESDLSTKLKLLGVEVASFGRSMDFWMKRQFDEKDSGIMSLECMNQLENSYRKLCFSADGTKLMGGILVGDAKDYTKLLQLSKKEDLGDMDPESLTYKKPAPGDASGAAPADGGDGTGLADDDLVCTCIGLSKKQIADAVTDKEATTIPLLKKCTKVGTGCGGCVTPVGAVPKILANTLKKLGKTGPVGICCHFAFSRRELFDIVRVKEIKSFDAALQAVGTGTEGCEICKPILASIIGGLWNEHILRDSRDMMQDTNDRFCANIQKTGTYSVIPRCAGGDMKPEEFIAFGNIAKKYGLWTKITGAQRLGMFGAPAHLLPTIWKELAEAGMESGQAYGKALRAVKSCVGSTWCRYGQQDSVTMAVTLENRYKGIRSPHKIKMGVSGCLRECAEAQGKDVGLIATQKGYNLYVCGNGGARPVHAALLAVDVDEVTAITYIDRVLMFYISTAKHLQRTAPWLEELPGGIDYLRKVVIDDVLGICQDLENMLMHSHRNYRCEWKEVAYDTDLHKKFQQYVNTTETQNSEHIEYIDVRGQRHPNIYSWPDITGPAVFAKEKAPVEGSEDAQGWAWVFGGLAVDYPSRGGGLAVKHGQAELAVFCLPGSGENTGRWFATQNICPTKQARTISRGLVGVTPDGRVTLADPIYKSTYELETGKGLSNPALNLSTFLVRVDQQGQVLLWLPKAETLSAAFEKQASDAAEAVGFKRPPSNVEGTGLTPTASVASSKSSIAGSEKSQAGSAAASLKNSPVTSPRRSASNLDW
jgi:nitrite reductase (NADH) large subunit